MPFAQTILEVNIVWIDGRIVRLPRAPLNQNEVDVYDVVIQLPAVSKGPDVSAQ